MKTYHFRFRYEWLVLFFATRYWSVAVEQVDEHCRSIIDIPVDAVMYIRDNMHDFYGIEIIYRFPA